VTLQTVINSDYFMGTCSISRTPSIRCFSNSFPRSLHYPIFVQRPW